MEDNGQEWHAHNLLQEERYRENVEALRRCKEAGAREEDLARLAFECGIDIKHINVDPSATRLG